MNEYKKAIKEAMELFAKDESVLFLGQQVASENFYGTLEGIDPRRRLEMPVAEELQLGMSIGMCFEGTYPVTIFQRMDFLMRAMDQLVNHLAILEEMSRKVYKAPMCIRTTIGNKEPLDAGIQHTQDHYLTIKQAVGHKMPIFLCKTPADIRDAYSLAREKKGPIIVIELQSLY